MIYDDDGRGRSSFRSRRNRSSSFQPPSPATVADLVRSVRTTWASTSGSTRILGLTLLFVGLSVSATVINVILHVSYILAFAIVPILLAPLLFTIMSGIGLFVFLMTMTAGAGFVFVGTPLFMVASIAKAILPLFIVAGVAATALDKLFKIRLFGSSNKEKRQKEEAERRQRVREEEEEEFRRVKGMKNELDDFDQMLRSRSQRSYGVTGGRAEDWDLSRVVDELDQCGLGRYRQLFIDERIDGNTLLSLTDADIREEFSDAMPLGDRRRLSRLISSLRDRSSSSSLY